MQIMVRLFWNTNKILITMNPKQYSGSSVEAFTCEFSILCKLPKSITEIPNQ